MNQIICSCSCMKLILKLSQCQYSFCSKKKNCESALVNYTKTADFIADFVWSLFPPFVCFSLFLCRSQWPQRISRYVLLFKCWSFHEYSFHKYLTAGKNNPAVDPPPRLSVTLVSLSVTGPAGPEDDPAERRPAEGAGLHRESKPLICALAIRDAWTSCPRGLSPMMPWPAALGATALPLRPLNYTPHLFTFAPTP